ncbi:hypothetical protein H7X68_03195 [Candidatus Saccharibacteria bacterium]|nr:hypothetical protein [Candidatus Saccharibacteria bacterium]
MNTNKQQGSAHLVIVVILVLALLGSLGFIFWQNVIKKDVVSSDKTGSTAKTADSSSKAAALKTFDFNSVFSVGLKVDYPKDWSVEQTTEGLIPVDADKGFTQQTVIITSPSGKLSVKYMVAVGGGLGGNCLPDETGKLTTVSNTALSAFAGGSFTEYNALTGAVYSYFSGIMDTTQASDVKPGDSLCEVAFANVIPLSKSDSTQLLHAKIHIKDLDDADGNSKDTIQLADIDSSRKTDEYKQAKAIMLSTTLNQ